MYFGKVVVITASLLLTAEFLVSAEREDAVQYSSPEEVDTSHGYPRYPSSKFRRNVISEDLEARSGEFRSEESGDLHLLFRMARSPESGALERATGTIDQLRHHQPNQLKIHQDSENWEGDTIRGGNLKAQTEDLQAAIGGVFAKISRKISSIGSIIGKAAGFKNSEHEQRTKTEAVNLGNINQGSSNQYKLENSDPVQFSSAKWTSRGSNVDQKIDIGRRPPLRQSSLCKVFNCNLGLAKKPNVHRSVSVTAQENEIRETVSQFLKSEDGHTKVNTVAYRNNLGEEGGDVKIAHSLSDQTKLNGRLKGNNQGDFKGDLDIMTSFNDQTSLNSRVYANNHDLGGALGVTHNVGDRTSLNGRVYANNQKDLGGDFGVTHILNDRTSLNAGVSGNNQGDLNGNLNVKHKFNDLTSVDGHAYANNEGEIKGDVDVTHNFNDRTSLNSRVYANNQKDLGGDVGVTHTLSDRTSLNGVVRGNNQGDLRGDLNIAHRFNDRTSLDGRAYANNQGELGGDFSLRRRVSDSTSLSAEASGNNRGELEGKLGIEHEFNDGISIGAGAHANNHGDVGVGLSITKPILKRR